MSDQPRWTIDRHIPVAVLIGFALQFGGAVWWTAKMDARMSAVEQMVASQTIQLSQVQAENQRMQVGAATFGAQITAVREGLTEVKDEQRETNDLLRQYLQERAP